MSGSTSIIAPATFASIGGSPTDNTALAAALNGKAATNRKLDDFGTPDDNTDLNATTLAHGLLPKLGGGTTNFLRADGAWAAPAGGSSLAFPKTLYVSASLGNDGTAVAGDPSKPFLTGQAAFNAWLLLGSSGRIHVMDGVVTGITLAADMMYDLHITGAGPWCKMTDVFADGPWGTDGGDDESGGPGGAGYEIRITSDLTVNLGSISSVGGQGGNGGFNSSNETDGGEGGRGGRVRLFNVLCDSFSNNGGGGGNPSEFGNPGAGGKPGDTTLINVHVRTGGISSQEAGGALTPDVKANLIRCIADSGAITVTAQLGEVAFCSASSYSVSGGVLEHSNHTMAYAPAWP